MNPIGDLHRQPRNDSFKPMEEHDLFKQCDKDAQAKNPIGDLHRQAMNYYTCLSPADKAKCMEFFKLLDEDESRKVTRRELALAVSDKDRRKILSYFDIIDLDCDGVLDFDECVTLYYLLNVPGKICRGCQKVLPYKSCCDACGTENLPAAKAHSNGFSF